MQNILINFTADGQGLQPGIEALDQLEQKDKEVADQAKKTMDAYEKRNKSVTKAAGEAAKGIDSMGTSFKNLDKIITGGAYQKALKELQEKVAGTGDEFHALALAVDFAKKRMATLDKDSEEFAALAKEVATGEAVLQAFGEGAAEAEAKTVSFRTRMRELKEELLAMEEAGLDGTDAFRDLSIEAAQLEDQIGDTQARIRALASDTFVFDAIIDGITGVTAGFSVAQGAVALFGDESDDMQKALLKVNAAMAILQGLQQIQNTLQAQSAVSLAVENAQRRIAALATNLQAAAESRFVVVRYAAIVAQTALNAVMALNPAGALLIAIGAVAGALVYFSSQTETATEKQKRFNEALLDELEYLEKLDSALTEPQTDRIKQLNDELTLMKAKGASQNAILQKELQIKEAEEQRANASAGFFAQERKNLEQNKSDLEGARRQLLQLKDEMRADGEDGFLKRLVTGGRSKDDIQGDIDAVETRIKALEKSIELGENAQTSLLDTTIETEAKVQEIILKNYMDSLKSAKAYAEARVLLAKQGSREELNARIRAVQAGLREELANVNLTTGERIKAQVAANREIAELQFDFEQNARQRAIKATDAQAALAKEDSRRRLDLELESLEQQKKAELQTTTIVNGQVVKLKELTEQQKLEIEDRYLKLTSDKIREYARKDAEYRVQARLSSLNADIARQEVEADAATNSQLLEQKKALIDAQAQLEIISINDTVHNEETRRARVKEVYARALADKIALEKAKLKAEIDTQERTITANYNRQAALLKRDNDLTGLSFFNKRKDAQAYFDTVAQGIAFEQAANEDRRAKDLISEQEYLDQKRQLNEQADDNEFARKQDHLARMQAIQNLAQQTAIALTNFAFNLSQKHYAAEEARVQELYDQKKISEQEYNNQLKTIRHKQDEDAKAQAVFQTLVQQGPTVLKGFQQGGFAGVAAAFALFFSLLSALQSTETPAYKDGEVLIQGPGTDTSDSIPVRISRNESVIRAAMSKKHTEALRAINEDRFEQYLRTVELPKFYQDMTLPSLPEYVVHNSNETQIDYEKLGEVFAQKIAEHPQYSLHFDEQGFHLAVKQGNDRIEYVNKKLST